MKRNPWIWVLTLAVLTPFAWLLATTTMGEGATGSAFVAGACLTGAGVVALIWRSHHRGVLLPNGCRTCGNGMRRVRPGELRPPASAKGKALPQWRCVRCGRMV